MMSMHTAPSHSAAHLATLNRTIDLTPRGRIVIRYFLSTLGTVDTGSYSTHCEPEHRAGLGIAIKEAREFAASLRTKAQADEVLIALGHLPGGKLKDSKVVIEIALIERWYPHVEVVSEEEKALRETLDRVRFALSRAKDAHKAGSGISSGMWFNNAKDLCPDGWIVKDDIFVLTKKF